MCGNRRGAVRMPAAVVMDVVGDHATIAASGCTSTDVPRLPVAPATPTRMSLPSIRASPAGLAVREPLLWCPGPATRGPARGNRAGPTCRPRVGWVDRDDGSSRCGCAWWREELMVAQPDRRSASSR